MNATQKLGTAPIWRAVVGLAVPTMLAQFVTVLYNIVDRIYIGNMPGVGQDALAGAGVCGPIVTVAVSFAYLVGLGAAPLIAIRLGEGEREKAGRILNCAVVLLTIAGLLLTPVLFAAKRPLLSAFGASPALYPYADEYLTYYSIGTVFAILAAGLNSLIVCQGNSRIAMAAIMLGAVVNIGLDPLLIFTCGMGVKGAAIATVVSQFLSAAFSELFLVSKHATVRIDFKALTLKGTGRILALGLSPFAIIATDSIMILALNAVLQRYGGSAGDTMVAAATIMLSFMQIVTMPLGGITSGTQPVLGYNYGARNTARVKRGFVWILSLCLVFTTVMFFLAQFAGDAFVRIFTRDEALAAVSVRFIKVYTLCIIPLSFQYVFVDGLTALGIAPAAFALSMTRKLVVMLTLTLTLPAVFGAESALYAEPIADAAASVVSTVVFLLLIPKILRRRAAPAPILPPEISS